jgi:hypothetical protein
VHAGESGIVSLDLLPTKTVRDRALQLNFERIAKYLKDLLTRVGALEAERTVHGGVNLAGTVHHGTGFSVVRNGAGDYTVTFSPAFGGAPDVAVTAMTNSRYIRVTAWPTANSFRVTFDRRGDATPAQTDTDFSFIARGAK